LDTGAIETNSPWPRWRGLYLNNNGQSSYQGPIGNGTKWKFPTPNSVATSPVIDSQGNSYFSSGFNLYKCNAAGSQLWTRATGGPITATAALHSNGIVYFGSTDNFFYALYSTNGNYYS
jgi:outer membrane protein assembly factor BamB